MKRKLPTCTVDYDTVRTVDYLNLCESLLLSAESSFCDFAEEKNRRNQCRYNIHLLYFEALTLIHRRYHTFTCEKCRNHFHENASSSNGPPSSQHWRLGAKIGFDDRPAKNVGTKTSQYEFRRKVPSRWSICWTAFSA